MKLSKSTFVSDVLHLATRVLHLTRGGLDSASPLEVASDLRHVKDQLRSLTDEHRVDSSDNDLSYACRVVAADLCTRLDFAESEHSFATADAFAQIWPKGSVEILSERLSWIREAASRPCADQDQNTSRSLWTTGPNQQYSAISGETKALLVREKPQSTPPSSDAATSSKVKDTLLNTDKAEIIQDFLLESLAFTSMHDREEEVPEAYRKTFEWIFTPNESQGEAERARRAVPQHNFVRWLQSSDHGQVYWANGKAGSGKSTLLRFVANHEQTTTHLRSWSGDLPLLAIRFFFWTGGSAIQRSQDGLLRSILHQLLDQRRDLIAWVFPDLWLECQDTKKRMKLLLSWEHSKLAPTFMHALELASIDSKICLFIDGLDEFEGREDTVISLVEDIVRVSPRVKACVSSRPWPAFERAFKNVPQILVQDLTGTDMVQYMTDQLRQGEHSRRLVQQMSSTELEQLQDEVLRRADGVFLWVSLAMRSALSSISDQTTFEDLLRQLRALPSDLEDLFLHLLFQDRTWEELSDQSQLFQIKRARDDVCDFTGDDSVRSITLWQMLHSVNGEQARIFDTIQQCDHQSALADCASFSATLDDLCTGLLTLTGPEKFRTRLRDHQDSETRQLQASANRRIHYVHRTVRDFLVHSGVWAEFLQHTTTSTASSTAAPFNPHISLLRSHVLRLRSPLTFPEKHRRLDEWWHDDVVLALTHARFASSDTASSQVALLDQFNDTLHWYWKPRGFMADPRDSFGRSQGSGTKDPQDTWARHAFGSYEVREKHKTPIHNPFLSLAAKFGLAEYLRLKLGSDEFAYKGGMPMLSHTLEFLVSRRKSVYPLASTAVIKVLLERGEDPNLVFKTMAAQEETPWLQAVKCLREAKRRGWLKPFDIAIEGTARWTTILEMLLEFGADKQAVIRKDTFDPEITVAGVVDDVAKAYFQADVWSVKEIMSAVEE